jgi:DNA-binding NarL/FixJ family response regulator
VPLGKKHRSSHNKNKHKLTNRELRVLHLIAQGMSNKSIASTLDIAEGTVKIHVHHILSKLGVNSRTGAVAAGLKSRILSI